VRNRHAVGGKAGTELLDVVLLLWPASSASSRGSKLTVRTWKSLPGIWSILCSIFGHAIEQRRAQANATEVVQVSRGRLVDQVAQETRSPCSSTSLMSSGLSVQFLVDTHVEGGLRRRPRQARRDGGFAQNPTRIASCDFMAA